MEEEQEINIPPARELLKRRREEDEKSREKATLSAKGLPSQLVLVDKDKIPEVAIAVAKLWKDIEKTLNETSTQDLSDGISITIPDDLVDEGPTFYNAMAMLSEKYGYTIKVPSSGGEGLTYVSVPAEIMSWKNFYQLIQTHGRYTRIDEHVMISAE
jgi:hypothetical protein